MGIVSAREAGSLLVALFLGFSASAVVDYADVRSKYSGKEYIVGIGEARKTEDPAKDRRVAEVIARLEIARQIRVHIREKTLDVMCEGKRSALFDGPTECRNQFLMVIEESVDLFLEGSRITDYGEKDGSIFAVAVMDRTEVSDRLRSKSREAADGLRDSLASAREGNSRSLRDATDQYKRALMYEKEMELVKGVRMNAEASFKDLEEELFRLSGKDGQTRREGKGP